VRGLTEPDAVEEMRRRRRGMKAVGDLARGVGCAEVGGRGAHRGNQAKVKVKRLGVRPGEGVGLGAARLEGLPRFRRRGRWFLLHTVRAVAAVSCFRRRLVPAGCQQRDETAPPLRESQQESVTKDQTAHGQAHTLILRWTGGKSPLRHNRFRLRCGFVERMVGARPAEQPPPRTPTATRPCRRRVLTL
jgi:hypothetical protein